MKIDPQATRAAVLALSEWLKDSDSVEKPGRKMLADATRYTARTLAEQAPGHAVELRIPPFVAVQCIDGPRHTRGVPPNVVETDPLTWLRLASGLTTIEAELNSGKLSASGTRALEISQWLPVVPLI